MVYCETYLYFYLDFWHGRLQCNIKNHEVHIPMPISARMGTGVWIVSL